MSEPTIELKEYVEKMLDQRDKRYDQRFIDNDRAVALALAAHEKAMKSTQWLIYLFVAIVLGLMAYVAGKH